MTVKDLGERISLDYLQIAYNFNQVQPFLCIKSNYIYYIYDSKQWIKNLTNTQHELFLLIRT